jgi:3-dehydroquinate dehydratase II
MPTHNIYILHGPNLNMLGGREPEIYGHDTLADVERELKTLAAPHEQVMLYNEQFNDEARLLARIHQIFKDDEAAGVIINPAAWTHTSIALRDALSMLAIPIIEVHISNVHAREDFRKHSYISDIAQGVICGLGTQGYSFALQWMLARV